MPYDQVRLVSLFLICLLFILPDHCQCKYLRWITMITVRKKQPPCYCSRLLFRRLNLPWRWTLKDTVMISIKNSFQIVTNPSTAWTCGSGQEHIMRIMVSYSSNRSVTPVSSWEASALLKLLFSPPWCSDFVHFFLGMYCYPKIYQMFGYSGLKHQSQGCRSGLLFLLSTSWVHLGVSLADVTC